MLLMSNAEMLLEQTILNSVKAFGCFQLSNGAIYIDENDKKTQEEMITLSVQKRADEIIRKNKNVS